MKETVWEQQHAFDLHRYRLLSAVPPIWTLVCLSHVSLVMDSGPCVPVCLGPLL